MNDIIFQVGDRVRVLPTYRERAPESTLPDAGILVVCRPGEHRYAGEVPIAHDRQTYYVPAKYVQAA